MKDIEESLNQGYPDHLKYKLLDRKAKSLVHLKKLKEAVMAYEDTTNVLQLSNLDDSARAEWHKALENKKDGIQNKYPSEETFPVQEDRLEHAQVI